MKSNYFSFVLKNRRFLGFGFLLALCSSYGQTYFISVFGGEIRATFDLTHGTFGLVYSIATLMSGLCMIWIGSLIDRVDLRVFTFLICVGLTVASVLTGWTSSVVMLGVAIFALRLSGQGLMSHASMTAMARYFENHRGKALSIANLGFPVGQAVFPVMGVALTAAIGWRQTWFVLAVLLISLLMPLLMWLLKDHDKRHKNMLSRTRAQSSDPEHLLIYQWNSHQVRRDLRFWLMAPSVLGLSLIGTGIVFHQVHLVETKGWSLSWFAANYTGMALSSVVTALISGPLVDRKSAVRLTPYYQVPAILSLVFLASGTGLWIVPVYMVLFGISVGMSRVVVGALWAEWYGVRHLGSIRALVAAMMVMASAASPVLFGWMIDRGVTIDTILFLSTAYTGASIVLTLFAVRITAKPH